MAPPSNDEVGIGAFPPPREETGQEASPHNGQAGKPREFVDVDAPVPELPAEERRLRSRLEGKTARARRMPNRPRVTTTKHCFICGSTDHLFRACPQKELEAIPQGPTPPGQPSAPSVMPRPMALLEVMLQAGDTVGKHLNRVLALPSQPHPEMLVSLERDNEFLRWQFDLEVVMFDAWIVELEVSVR